MNNRPNLTSEFAQKLADSPELKLAYDRLAQELRHLAKEEDDLRILDIEKLPPMIWIL